MLEVLRIETLNGGGPYGGRSSIGREMFDLDGAHPGVTDDKGLRAVLEDLLGPPSSLWWDYRDKYHFGFCSFEQYFAWVYEPIWRTVLHRENFVLSVYCAEDVIVGTHQVMFCKGSAEHLRYLDLSMLEHEYHELR